MSKLRLGPIINEKPVKLNLELPGPLLRSLREYAEVHAHETGLTEPLPPERLIAPILEKFISGDRGFLKLRKIIR